MSDSLRPNPPRIRVRRPYASEEAFMQGDFHRIGRNSVVLPVACSHPVGEVVRFEVLIAGGAVVFRGEGPVVAHHAPGGPKPAGVEIRVTRFDARSKSILDRVHALRLARARSGQGSTTHSLPPNPLSPGSVSVRPPQQPSGAAPAPAPHLPSDAHSPSHDPADAHYPSHPPDDDAFPAEALAAGSVSLGPPPPGWPPPASIAPAAGAALTPVGIAPAASGPLPSGLARPSSAPPSRTFGTSGPHPAARSVPPGSLPPPSLPPKMASERGRHTATLSHAPAPMGAPSPTRTPGSAKRIPPPPNRDALLEELRSRARDMQASGGLRYKTLKR